MISEQKCVSHKCDKCEEELHVYSVKNKIITIVVMLLAFTVVVSVFLGLESLTTTLPDTYCYEKHFLSGYGTNVEIIRNVDIKCPN